MNNSSLCPTGTGISKHSKTINKNTHTMQVLVFSYIVFSCLDTPVKHSLFFIYYYIIYIFMNLVYYCLIIAFNPFPPKWKDLEQNEQNLLVFVSKIMWQRGADDIQHVQAQLTKINLYGSFDQGLAYCIGTCTVLLRNNLTQNVFDMCTGGGWLQEGRPLHKV